MADWRMDQDALVEHVQREGSDALEGERVQPGAGVLNDYAAEYDFCGHNIIFMQEVSRFTQL